VYQFRFFVCFIVCVISSFRLDADENCALFNAVTQRLVVFSYGRFGKAHRSHLQSPLKMGTMGCTETSVRNYHDSLRNSPEECTVLICLFVDVLLTECSFHVIVFAFVSLYRHLSLHPFCTHPFNPHLMPLFSLHYLPPPPHLGLNSVNAAIRR